MSLLEVHNVDAHYDQAQALFSLSMHCEMDETVAVIGANGAGKSTLLRCIAGIVPLSEGVVSFDGSDISDVPAHRRVGLGISMVPEGRRLFPSMTVADNLLLGAHSGRPGAWNTDAVLELFPLLDPLMDRATANLSGGEQQAVAIGRALMANPRLFLLDEVSLGLAPVVVKQLYAALPSIRASGCAVVVVEQDINQALDVASRFVCLLEGSVSLEGEVGAVGRDAITAAYFGRTNAGEPR